MATVSPIEAGPVDRPRSGTNYAMNALRFTAAFFVVVSHLRALFFVDFADAVSNNPLVMLTYGLTSLGHQAVIVFFVLSGYWVGGSALRNFSGGRFELLEYSVARILRLWIVLVPALLITQILDRSGTALWPSSDIYAGSSAYHSVVPSGGAVEYLDAGVTSGNLFFLQSIYVPAEGTNTPLWSLATEFWYYLLFPALLFLVWRGVSIRARLIAAGIASLCVLLLILAPMPGGPQVFVLFPAWLMGVAVAAARPRAGTLMKRVSPHMLSALRVIALALLVGVALIDSRSSSVVSVYVLSVAAAMLLTLLISDVQNPVGRRFLAPLSWAAEWSYSLYALHLPVLAFAAAMIVPSAADRWQMDPIGVIRACAVLASVLAAAFALYLVTEKHTTGLRRFAIRKLRRSSRRRAGIVR